MGKTLTYIFTLVCAVALPGCQEELPDADLVGTLWTLESIEVPGEPDVLPEATKVYNIQFFGNDRFNGRDDCNVYGGNYALSGDSGIRLDRIVTTLAGCASPLIGHPYYLSLRVVDAYKISGNTLSLHFDNGSVLKYRYTE